MENKKEIQSEYMLREYQNAINELTSENLMLRAYIAQLEEKFQENREKENE
ncbi:hypothetical protein 015DV004_177 [Bacillus phage 015DV004]|nr:hypothetical protein 015DV004_177 [Bacillus phage 015DV004]